MKIVAVPLVAVPLVHGLSVSGLKYAVKKVWAVMPGNEWLCSNVRLLNIFLYKCVSTVKKSDAWEYDPEKNWDFRKLQFANQDTGLHATWKRFSRIKCVGSLTKGFFSFKDQGICLVLHQDYIACMLL